MDIEIERENDGRWVAEIAALPGCMVYGATREEAVRAVEVLVLQILLDRLNAGEETPINRMFRVAA